MVTEVNVNLKHAGGLILKNSQKEAEDQLSFSPPLWLSAFMN